MDKFIQNMFKIDRSPITNKSSDTDKIINESIILDKVDGNRAKLSAIYEAVGKYGARDGLLNECPTFPEAPEHRAKLAAILACAKEAGSPEYEMYMKAIALEKSCIDAMERTYGNIANNRVEENEKKLEDNVRIATAIQDVNSNAPEACGKETSCCGRESCKSSYNDAEACCKKC